MHVIMYGDRMVSITLAVPLEMKKEMEQHPEINWSAVAREAIKQRIVLMKKFVQFTRQSELTEKDALELGKLTSRRMAKRHEA